MKMLKILSVLAFLPALAFAQSSPGLVTGQVPSATQWNSYFAAKQNNLGYTPMNPGNNLSDVYNITAAKTNLGVVPFTSTVPGIVPATGIAPSTDVLFANGTWGPNPGSGSVLTVSVVSANGMAGTVANPTTTPAITLSTTITGILKGNGTAISAASAGTDYLSPTLTSTHLLVGNGSNIATSVAVSGDATLANTGALTVGAIGGKSVSLGANFTTTGAGAPTLAFPSSSFTYTLPGATGTLAELGLAQSWMAAQTFGNNDLLMLGSSTGTTTISSGNGGASNYTATVPANTGTISELNLAQTWLAAQTYTNSDLLLLGSSTGSTTFTSDNSSGTNYTVHIPASNGTMVESVTALPGAVTGTPSSSTFLRGDGTWASPSGSGTVNSGTAGQLAYYATSTNAVSGETNATVSAGALTLGASGTAGSVTLGNATSGTVTVQPVTGALGSVTASLPANTGTVAELNLAQTFTAVQQFPSTLSTSTGTPSSSVHGLWTIYTSGTGWIGVGASDGISFGNGNLTGGGLPSATLATLSSSGAFATTGTIASGANSGTLGQILLNGSTSGQSGFKAAAAAGSTVWQLPAADGSANGCLQTNGSAVLSFTTSPCTNLAPLTAGSSTGNTLTAPIGYFVCTSTCTVTPPVPAAGYQFCVMNDDNVSTVITLGALGLSALYENTSRTAYGTAGTGTLTSNGAVGNMVCIVGRDATHYMTTTYVGTWTAS